MTRLSTSTVPYTEPMRRPLRRVEQTLRTGLLLLLIVVALAAANMGVMLALLVRLPPPRLEPRPHLAEAAVTSARPAEVEPRAPACPAVTVASDDDPSAKPAPAVRDATHPRSRSARAPTREPAQPPRPMAIATEPGF